jgi:ribosome biogenesis protein UTP30
MSPAPDLLLPISSLPSNIPSQAEKAIKALLKHLETSKATKQKDESGAVEENEQWIYLVITMKKMPKSEKHVRIRMYVGYLDLRKGLVRKSTAMIFSPLPNPIMSPTDVHSVCLLVKDPEREVIGLLKKKNIGWISQVVGIEKLQGRHDVSFTQ